MYGVRAEISSKSFAGIFIPHSFAIAVKCKTVFELPPIPMSTVIAFSNAFNVKISRGKIFFFNKFITTLPARFAKIRRAPLYAAGIVPLPASAIPNASLKQFIVLAVKSPAQLPQLGQAFFSSSVISSSVILPAANFPAASKD